MLLQRFRVDHCGRQRVFNIVGHVVTQWTVPIANTEEMLISLILNVCIYNV